MLTRDSNGWWWVMGGAVVTALSSRMDLIDRLIPAVHKDWVHALIEILALVVLAGAGVARMSPLPISPEGRVEAIAKNADHADKASTAASAAAVASDTAAKVSTIAAKAAEVAADESQKASGIKDN